METKLAIMAVNLEANISTVLPIQLPGLSPSAQLSPASQSQSWEKAQTKHWQTLANTGMQREVYTKEVQTSLFLDLIRVEAKITYQMDQLPLPSSQLSTSHDHHIVCEAEV